MASAYIETTIPSYLVTWNFKHIANPFIRNRLREVVLDSGFMLPVICTPEELLNDESD